MSGHDFTLRRTRLPEPKPFVFVEDRCFAVYWIVGCLSCCTGHSLSGSLRSPYGPRLSGNPGQSIEAERVGVFFFLVAVFLFFVVPLNYKVLAFTLSAAFAGLAGTLCLLRRNTPPTIL